MKQISRKIFLKIFRASGIAVFFWTSAAFGQVAGMATGNGYPQGATPLIGTATGTTAGATATLAGATGRVTFLCGFHYEPGTATAAVTTSLTTTGLSSNLATAVNSAATAATATAGPIVSQIFSPCLPASAPNTAITVVAGALGAGGTNQNVNAWGYQAPQN
jgi:hypothetical protein